MSDKTKPTRLLIDYAHELQEANTPLQPFVDGEKFNIYIRGVLDCISLLQDDREKEELQAKEKQEGEA